MDKEDVVCIDSGILVCCCSLDQLCPTLCDPMDYSMSGFSVLHDLLDFAETHAH